MALIPINLNHILFLDKISLYNEINIDGLNHQALQSNLENALSFLTQAAERVEKFHSFFHWEQSFFHLQLAFNYLKNNQKNLAKIELENAIFQDHLNQAALELFKDLNAQLSSLPSYSRPFNAFKEYIDFSTGGNFNNCENTKTFIDSMERPSSAQTETSPYWCDWKLYLQNFEENILINISRKLRKHHLNYHQEAAKIYLNRAQIFNNLNQQELAKNDLIKASNLDDEIKQKAYYINLN